MTASIPRLMIAGLSGDSGKTIVCLSIMHALRCKGLNVSAFKKGPDYIDSAWLGRVAGKTCRNLDTFMVDSDAVLCSFIKNAFESDITLIEGNRGVFDGKDIRGTHSSGELAKLLRSPVILVINCSKVTRTTAAVVSGCLSFDPKVNFAGVILNKVAGKRHRGIITESIEKYCKLPVLGAIPRLGDDSVIIPGRHLGLVTPREFEKAARLEDLLREIADRHLDIEGLMKIAHSAPPLGMPESGSLPHSEPKVRIGYFNDSVFTFYYPENLEALQSEGAELVAISSTEDKSLPDVDALYIGGGFPETQAECLNKNQDMLRSVRAAAEDGLPIYAECGGLIYLSGSLTFKDKKYPMAGVFPTNLIMKPKPAGHGYSTVRVDRPNPFFEVGTEIKGHEFHYSALKADKQSFESCLDVEVGVGLGEGRDGLLYRNTIACYTHIHADGVESWASNMVRNALERKMARTKTGCTCSRPTAEMGGHSRF
ncbi:MAG: hydrogenobyrinic acid a,c-diamide synthase (glutamine-hydrolyzing) [Candidatus Zixiibacteriota bacterium]|nr:MAG: hydrogenobyrinic acid a,c-diamide synthase (glutamine-hydrolyzing) [candidate division Zixibacteria bacterium]